MRDDTKNDYAPGPEGPTLSRGLQGVGKVDGNSITSRTMEKQLSPLVVRIPALVLTPQLQRIVDSSAEDFDVIAVNRAAEISSELAQQVEGLLHYSPSSAHHLVGRIGTNLVDLFPSLKVISNHGVGINRA